ncbi:MAG: ATP-binding protein [Anaerolineae bacterium]
MKRRRLGVVTDGAFNAGLTVRLDADRSTEDLRVGDFVVIEGKSNRYFSIISDMQLRVSDPRLLASPPDDAPPLVAHALAGTSTYANVEVKPMLMLDLTSDLDELRGPQPVRTIPMHFAALYEASEMDFATVFGKEGGKNFAVGTPVTMDIPICLRLDRFVERSNGIFGQSGTGKSFLARLLLCGIINSRAAANLIFDMHSEYAFDKQTEDGHWVRGLRELLGSQVLVYSLDAEAAARRNVDVTLSIGLNQIEAEDIMLLADELDLTATTAATAGLLGDQFGEDWLHQLLAMSPDELVQFCQSSGAHPEATKALQRKLREVQRRGYLTEKASFSLTDEMVTALGKGRSVILEFGRHDSPLDYMLVANIVTRRVRRLYQQKMERFEETKAEADRPLQLMITLEEAHKFLNPTVARQTIFGTIAREMRKYNVTLMVIDQRPSGIDSEVMSQLGTRITGLLTEERDMDAVLTGVSGRSFLRGSLTSLDTRQQVLLMGHAVPMPVVVQTRSYGEEFYRAMGRGSGAEERPEVSVTDVWAK